MANIKELKELALHAARHTAPANYSCENVDEALAGEFRNMASSINEFQRNKYDIFEIMIETADEVVPKKVIDQVAMFAEVKTVAQGQKAMFKRKVGKNRARKFLTQVGLSGVYETFRLDSDTFEVSAHAVGGAGTIDFERMLDGAETMSDVMDVITEGLTDAAFYEIHRALQAAFSAAGRPAANKKLVNSFDAQKMQELIGVVRAYGQGAVIFACPEFIAAMGPDAIVPPAAAIQGVYSPDDIDAIHRTGYIKIFRGCPVIEIPQSYTDNSNTTTQINPQYAYVLPTGGEKVVKLVFEGQTQMWDQINRDQSIEINAYKKMGAAVISHHNWGIYKNEGITDTSADRYGF